MLAHWFIDEENLGDRLSPIIIEHVTGIKPKWVSGNFTGGKLLGLGSILEHTSEKDIIWGTGTKYHLKLPELRTPPLALRGPRSAECFGAQGTNLFGDPGIILPEIIKPENFSEDKIVVIPHYVDYQILKTALYSNHSILNETSLVDVKREAFQSVINKIGEAKLVISSSLHGIIFAEAYNKPALWVKASDKILGGNFKFNDYYEGSGRSNNPIVFENDFSFIKIAKPPPLPKSNIHKIKNILQKFYKNGD